LEKYLAHLPHNIQITKARVASLKLHIPAEEFYSSSSGIYLEIEGIVVEAKLCPEAPEEKTHNRTIGTDRTRRSKGKADVDHGRTPKSPRLHGDHHGIGEEACVANENAAALPTASDLAHSFLLSEPKAEREQLQATLSKTYHLEQSHMSESGEDTALTGLGEGFSMPGFLAGFIAGVVDRAHAVVKHVRVELSMPLEAASSLNQSASEIRSESVGFQLCVNEISVGQVTNAATATTTHHKDEVDASETIVCRRVIRVMGIEAAVFSGAAVFVWLSQNSSPPSPNATMDSDSRKSNRSQDSQSTSDETSSSSETGLGLTTSDLGVSKESGRGFVSRTLSDVDYSVPADPASDRAPVHSVPSSAQLLERSDTQDLPSDEYPVESTYMSYCQESFVDAASQPHEPISSSQETFDGNKSGTSISNDMPLRPSSFGERFLGASSSRYLVDNHISALESQQFTNAYGTRSEQISSPDPEIFEYGDTTEESPNIVPSRHTQDLTQSTLFSHEEAQSMYQSAVSHGPSSSHSWGPIPGQWSDDDATKTNNHGDIVRSPTPTPKDLTATSKNPSVSEDSVVDSKEADSVDEDNSQLASSVDTTTPKKSPNMVDDVTGLPIVLKRIFEIDLVTFEFPTSTRGAPIEEETAGPQVAQPTKPFRDIPGGFDPSVVGANSLYMLREGVQADAIQGRYKSKGNDTSERRSIPAISIGNVDVEIDLTLIRLAMIVIPMLSLPRNDAASKQTSQDLSPAQDVCLAVDNMHFDLVSSIPGSTQAQSTRVSSSSLEPRSARNDTLLSLQLSRIAASQMQLQNSIRREIMVGNLTFGYKDEAILKFDSSRKLRESVRDVLAPIGQDIKITTTVSPSGPSEVTILTVPVHINLNLTRLDEMLGWFGGLSGMLEIGSSVMSTVTVTEHKSKPAGRAPTTRAVRFESPTPSSSVPASTSAAGNKITARIGGLAFDLHGQDASISIESSAIKVVSRAEGIGARIDKLKLVGPQPVSADEKSAITVMIGTVKLEYVEYPSEDDLGRLLAMLSPSREQEDTDDDILLDTFLRQRRQGGVLRLNVDSVKGVTGPVEGFDRLLAMSDELKKLGSVAKYLPEDDRPGVLTLARVQQLDLDVDVNETFGTIGVTSSGIEIGHVSFPSLFLLGIETVGVQHQSLPILGMTPSDMSGAGAANLPSQPALTARFIGDELEPTLKVRLWHLQVDYRVSTIMTLLGITETASGEVIVNELAQSIADLASQSQRPALIKQESSTSTDSSTSKSLRFDFSIRDCLVALNPRKSPAQALLVFTQATIRGNFPKAKQPDFRGCFTINRMGILVIDDSTQPQRQLATLNQRTGDAHKEQIELLKSLGYVSVSDISSASIEIVVVPSAIEDQRYTEVTIRDDLFVLETCADSMQTLQAVMNGLSPPTPPSKELKYRTEVVPVQDMLASFTGDAFVTSIDDEDDTDYKTELSEEELLDDDLPPSLDMESSFYDSLPNVSHLGLKSSDLLESTSTTKASSPGQPSELISPGLSEQSSGATASGSLHFDENYFGTASQTGINARKWNSDRNTFEASEEQQKRPVPFRLRLNDVHFIWNLFDGYDWQHTRDTISHAVAEVESKAAEKQARRHKRKSLEEEEEDEDSVIGDFLFNSIYIGVGVNQNPRDLTHQINRHIDDLASETESYATTTATAMSASPSRQGYSKSKPRRRRLRLQRSKHHKMTFELKGVSADVVVFQPGSGETQSKIDIKVHDIDIFDHVPTSTWKKFATYMHDAGEREAGSNMALIEILNVRPDPALAATEIVLKATILPLRLHVDQDALDFITRFFSFKDDSATTTSPSPSEVPFIQRAEINSIPVKLDFKPKRVDYGGLRSGKTTEFMNFIVLDGADLVLRHVIIYGISGFDKLGITLNDIWSPDVKQNQLPGVLAGLAPVRSLVNVGSGVRDLVVIPMREYRKDGRIMRSIQKGALAFAKTTTTELTKLGAKVAVGTQTLLQNAEGVLVPKAELSSDAQLSESPPEEKTIISPYADPPVGVVQGLRGGYRHLERDLLMARDAIVAMPGEVMDSSSAGGAAKAVLRSAPTVVLRPALGVSKAVGQALMGVTSALDKGERRRLDDVSLLQLGNKRCDGDADRCSQKYKRR
jgi:autophagy-related protein 2